MCGRYALGIRATFVRHQLQDHGMPVAEAPDDEDVRQTYNFAPGNYGLVYRADVPDHGAGGDHGHEGHDTAITPAEGGTPSQTEDQVRITYKLQPMKWGLVPFWTKRNPDYGTVMKTINARDDSLAVNRGMWNTMKQKKRCIIVAQGFYEWLKKNGGKEKIPHYVKRKDEQLMCFAGLWDCVKYEGSEDKLYTYTIITTDSNRQLKFLHDRMPVILENGSDDIRTWLDPKRTEWSNELQSLLQPFKGELECYPVSKDVGKVGNNSPAFIIPVASSENKNNIANFFSNTKAPRKGKANEGSVERQQKELDNKDFAIDHNDKEQRITIDESGSEDNAPLPGPEPSPPVSNPKRGQESVDEESARKLKKTNTDEKHGNISFGQSKQTTEVATARSSKTTGRQTRSAISNNTTSKVSPSKPLNRSQRITNFFGN